MRRVLLQPQHGVIGRLTVAVEGVAIPDEQLATVRRMFDRQTNARRFLCQGADARLPRAHQL